MPWRWWSDGPIVAKQASLIPGICELTEAELDDVVGGDAALSHELPHASHTPKQPLIVIIAVLIG
jgi:hypothetical protein